MPLTPAALPALAPAATPGQPETTIDTPSLVLDLDAFERNLDRMQQAADRAGVNLRPHAKAHKTPAIALAQIARGAVGICCQKVSEALPFLRAGVRDIHISNEIAGPAKASLLARMAVQGKLSVCVDDASQIDVLAAALENHGSTLSVLVELDIGQGRCGVGDADEALRLVESIQRHPSMRFAGLQAYHGGIQHLRSQLERRDAAARSAERAGEAAARLEAAGARCDIITGGGSGSFAFDLTSGVFTEIQPGSYVFMDVDYGRNEVAEDSGDGVQVCPRFEHSLFIASTVMSTAASGQVVVDAGLKSMAVDSGLPWVWNRPAGEVDASLQYIAANDEHGLIRASGDGGALPALGTPVWLVPGHCDPTLNLYDELIGVRGGAVEVLWPVAARGLSR
ncbi:DSD1 family PLP-dependent enzyme [Cupriavidus sp. AU9028]|uniref:DSD1 family PLP-dependent enzyme n=1 Tax=Cupriavidus sp. AU9028 TaxID=2871157 RepID=UPI001C957390|nr:DSD1 family PLP-dependent enzyme [Cupriavidus sp. AU9028]MBY4896033.1 DSD1 family PLP-dependent enzyme [Cupriavidus sp. AU9028]